MRYIQWLILSCLILTPMAWGETKLDSEALQKFFQTGEQLEQVSGKYPQLNEQSDEFLLNGDNEALLERLQKAGALQEVNAVVKENGYESMDEYIDVTKRIMAAYFAVQLEQTPEYSSAEEMRQMVAAQKKELEANGVAPEMVEQMMESVQQQLEQLDTLFAFAETAKPEDVAAVKRDLEYVNKQMGQ